VPRWKTYTNEKNQRRENRNVGEFVNLTGCILKIFQPIENSNSEASGAYFEFVRDFVMVQIKETEPNRPQIGRTLVREINGARCADFERSPDHARVNQ
jgi:hypothetical protein